MHYLIINKPVIRLIIPPNRKNDFGPLISNIRWGSGGFRLDFPKFEFRIFFSQARVRV